MYAIITGLAVMVGTLIYLCKKEHSRFMATDKIAQKYHNIALMMDLWVENKQWGKNLSSWFEERGYKKIAIYGMGIIGKRLTEELYETKTCVAYGIDQNAEQISVDICVKKPIDELEQVDVVVVTANVSINEVRCTLQGKLDCPIVSFEEILEKI